MTYFPDAVPSPEPTIDDKPFWDFCGKKELRFQRCGHCGKFRAPPSPTCPHCGSELVAWVEARDEAELFSYTVVHFRAHPAVDAVLPYNVAIVRFPSFDDVRLISNVVGVASTELRIGMELRLIWETDGRGMALPRFAMKGQ